MDIAQYVKPYLFWRDFSQRLAQCMWVSAVAGTVLVPPHEPPVRGVFQLSHGLQEGISNAVSHVAARVTLRLFGQPIHLLAGESHPCLVNMEMDDLFASISGKGGGVKVGRFIPEIASTWCMFSVYLPIGEGNKDPSLEAP